MSQRTPFLAGLPLAVLLGTAVLGQCAAAAAPSTAVVAKLDKDNDKILDAKEVEGVIGKSTFKAADPDNDGTLSKAEYLELVKQLFHKADGDNDGTLDAKELSSKAGRTLKRLID